MNIKLTMPHFRSGLIILIDNAPLCLPLLPPQSDFGLFVKTTKISWNESDNNLLMAQ